MLVETEKFAKKKERNRKKKNKPKSYRERQGACD